jgi:hypothetical protein
MVIKKKLSLGLGFLFFIIFVLVVFCSFYIGKLSQEAGHILRDNYYSLVYSKNMISSLENLRTAVANKIFNPTVAHDDSDYFALLFEKERTEFEKNLAAEKRNITEIHESSYVESINRDYELFLKFSRQMNRGSGSSALYFNEFQPAYERLKQSIDQIHAVNFQAVVRKSQITRRDSRRINNYMAGIGAFCLILAFAYFWYFPFYIANSISYLAENMRQLLRKMGIAHDMKAEDEFSLILQAIRLIESKYFGESKKQEPL